MKAYAQKQPQPQQQTSPSITRPSAKPLVASHTVNSISYLQRAIGTQAVQQQQPRASVEGPEVGSDTSVTNRFAHDFSRVPVSSKSPARFQAKLTVNTPGDAYEQEADRLSEQVMSMAEPLLQRTCACGGGGCLTCRNEQATHERLQTNRAEANDSGGLPVPPVVNEVLNSSGQPLDSSTRAFMEPRFGHDFSRVRVHTDARVAESARAVNALAYTVGRDVVFGPGHYRPSSLGGRKLLAHELTHVLQQGAGGRLEEGVFNAGGPSEQAAARILPDWIACRMTPQPRHVVARMSSGDVSPTPMSETPESEAGNEATLYDASALGVEVSLKHFYNKKGEFTKTLPAGCENKPSETGVGADGLAANGMVMSFVVKSKKPAKTGSGQNVPVPDIKFKTDQNRSSYSWQRMPVNGVQKWVELGPPRINWSDPNYHQHCWIPDKDNEIFHWDRPGWLGIPPDLRGQDYDDYTVSEEATGFVLKTNFETYVLAGPEGKETRLPGTYYWHSINCMGPVGEGAVWQMTDNPTKNEIELGKTAPTKPVDVK